MVQAGLLNEDGSVPAKPFVSRLTPEEYKAQFRRPTVAEIAPSVCADAARESLREAHSARASAKAKLREVQEVVERGRKLVASLAAEAASFAGVEDEADAARADSLRNGAPLDLPPALADRLRRKTEIDADAEAARRAHALLADEAIAAQQELDAAARAVERAVESVLVAEGEAVVAEMLAAERRALDLRHSLQALSMTWIGRDGAGRPRPFPLSPRLRAALNEPPLNAAPLPPGPDPLAPLAAGWRGYADRLLADPNADANSDDEPPAAA
jgi:hypothetical protein